MTDDAYILKMAYLILPNLRSKRLPLYFAALLTLSSVFRTMSKSTTVSKQTNFSRDSGQVIGIWWTNKKVLNQNTPDLEISSSGEMVATATSKLVKDIRYSLLTLKGDFMDSAGTTVRYDLIRKSQKFSDYLQLVRKLEFVDMNEMTLQERKAFLINIYNSLVIHALVEGLLGKFPGGSLSRLQVSTLH